MSLLVEQLSDGSCKSTRSKSFVLCTSLRGHEIIGWEAGVAHLVGKRPRTRTDKKHVICFLHHLGSACGLHVRVVCVMCESVWVGGWRVGG